jgi:hypothetical protein
MTEEELQIVNKFMRMHSHARNEENESPMGSSYPLGKMAEV